MKLLLTLILALVSFTSSATIPDKFTVYSSQVSGLKNTFCRAIFEQYTKTYNATAVFEVKPGADGVIATEELFHDKSFAVLCSGAAESIFNNFIYKGHEEAHAALNVVAIIGYAQTVLYTGTGNKYDTLPELLKNKKSILVGYNTTGLKLVAQKALEGHDVTWVPFKQASDALPALMDGTLDMFTDAGILEPIAKGGKIKSLGYINGPSTTSGINLNATYKEAAKLKIFMAVTTSNTTNEADVIEMNRRLSAIINSPELQKLGVTTGLTMFTGTLEDARELITHGRVQAAKMLK
jgi:tripartite-type tricarboxylate transporter receptor subunit TctC